MKILFLNNDGGGFADHIEIEPGTTLSDLFAARIPHASPSDYLIRVNRQPAASDQVLQEGDRVSLTPTKIEGALPGLALNAGNCCLMPDVFLISRVERSTQRTRRDTEKTSPLLLFLL